MNSYLYQNQLTIFSGMPRMRKTKVDEKLFRGGAVTSPMTLYRMKKTGITQIIDLRNSAFLKSSLENIMCKMLGIKYLHMNFPHRRKTLPQNDFFERINNSIEKNTGKTYLHCEYGKHRTGLAVAIYEKFHTSKTKEEITQNMINNGYDEIISHGKTKKEQKYINLYQQMINRYF